MGGIESVYLILMDKTLISILGGIGGMFGWGISDFFANDASEKVGHRRAYFWSQIAGIALMAVVALLYSADFNFEAKLIPFMLVAGTSGAIGYLFFYKGFEIGNISVVSSVINLQVLFTMGIAFFVFGQTLSTLQIFAIAMVIGGITMVSTKFSDLRNKVSLAKGVKETLIA